MNLSRGLCLTIALAALAALPTAAQSAQPIKHVLLISVDGMHAVDFMNCANGISTVNNGQPFCPAIAALGLTGVNYVSASTSKPSDSFPGLTAIVAGGSPALTGVYYDVAYSRNFDAPAKTTGNGLAAPTWMRFVPRAPASFPPSRSSRQPFARVPHPGRVLHGWDGAFSSPGSIA